MEKEEKDRNEIKRIIKFIAFLLIVIIVILLLRSCSDCNGGRGVEGNNPIFSLEEDPNAQQGGLTVKSQEEIKEKLNQKVDEGMINISMNLNPVFENGKSEGNLLIVNEEKNRNPQVVEIYRKETEELIYKSGLIPVGNKVETGNLLVELEKGDYPCIAYFNAVNGETGELIGKAGAELTISVLK